MTESSTEQTIKHYVSPAVCSSCTGVPHLNADGVALFCENCSKRARAKPQRYDIGRGGPPERSSPA